jgi:glycogen synthase
MRYGAPPIVAATGGLVDTVEDADVLTGGACALQRRRSG